MIRSWELLFSISAILLIQLFMLLCPYTKAKTRRDCSP